MYKNILIPLDRSSLAEQVLPYSKILAKGFDAEIRLIRVVPPLEYERADPVMDWDPMAYAREEPGGGASVQQMMANVRTQAERYLEDIADSLKEEVNKISTTVLNGKPEEEIAKEAQKYPEAILAMSTHGRSGINRLFIGSVTDKLMRTVKNPLLVIHPLDDETASKEVTLTTLVVPLDGSELAEESLPYAVQLVKKLDLKLTLLRVTPSPADFYHFTGFGTLGVYHDLAQNVDEDATAYLERKVQDLQKQGLKSVEGEIYNGRAQIVIGDYAAEKPGTLVVMTTHGRSGLGRWLLGSVTDSVVRNSGAPVLVVRARGQS